MGLWRANLDGSSIHLAVEGSCGGSSLGIQLARQAIEDGGRVLWASPELPDGTRFSQIFEGLNLTASSISKTTSPLAITSAFSSTADVTDSRYMPTRTPSLLA